MRDPNAPPHMSLHGAGTRDITLSKNAGLIADWHRLRKLAIDKGYDLHQHCELFEMCRGKLGENHSVVRYNTLQEVQDFLTR